MTASTVDATIACRPQASSPIGEEARVRAVTVSEYGATPVVAGIPMLEQAPAALNPAQTGRADGKTVIAL
jgi:hypothetical protein